eukprot:TRINITY_DN62235_c0_g1_i1.p1 TRINITY_DN62235_c0_g1~~TRINITY_DN62235_c0_g1_i1.p1  ORF type:complete len:282 (+),score=16.95 TRINITY_DN62235_c0_g1_i1:128-847(+)
MDKVEYELGRPTLHLRYMSAVLDHSKLRHKYHVLVHVADEDKSNWHEVGRVDFKQGDFCAKSHGHGKPVCFQLMNKPVRADFSVRDNTQHFKLEVYRKKHATKRSKLVGHAEVTAKELQDYFQATSAAWARTRASNDRLHNPPPDFELIANLSESEAVVFGLRFSHTPLDFHNAQGDTVEERRIPLATLGGEVGEDYKLGHTVPAEMHLKAWASLNRVCPGASPPLQPPVDDAGGAGCE